MDPSRRGFLKRAAGTAAAGAAMATAGPQITALVSNFSKEVGGTSGIQALKAMLKVATAAEIDDMYSAASSSVMSDGITDSDMTALEQSGWADRPDVKSWLLDNADDPDDPYWDDFQQWYYDHYPDEAIGIYDAFKEVTGKPLKLELISNIIPGNDLCNFFDEYPEALEIINLQSASVPTLEKLENIDVAAKGANLPTPVVTAANAISGLVRQIFKSNGKPLTAPQPVKAAPALPAPTRPEVELPVNVTQKQAEPVQQQGNGQEVEETLEYSHMDPEFAAKAVTLLGLKGDKAYDDIKQLAIEMGQVREFRNLMNAANGMAFSEYDTNPGDFKNWWKCARDLFAKFAQ